MSTTTNAYRPPLKTNPGRSATSRPASKNNDDGTIKVDPKKSPSEGDTNLQQEVRDTRNEIIDASNVPADQAKLFEALDGQQMQDRQLEEFQQLEEMLLSVKQNPNSVPKIQTAPTASAADIKSGKAPATALPKGVDAVYIPSKNIILVRDGLKGKDLKAAVREEMGEWLGQMFIKTGGKPAAGDTGARVSSVLGDKKPTESDFMAKESDTTTVRFEGKELKARARTKTQKAEPRSLLPIGKSAAQRASFAKSFAAKDKRDAKLQAEFSKDLKGLSAKDKKAIIDTSNANIILTEMANKKREIDKIKGNAVQISPTPAKLSVWDLGDRLSISGTEPKTAGLALGIATNKTTFSQKDIDAFVKQGVLTKGADGKYKVDFSKLSIGQQAAIFTGAEKLTGSKARAYGIAPKDEAAWQKNVFQFLGARESNFKPAVEAVYRTKGESYSQALTNAFKDGYIRFKGSIVVINPAKREVVSNNLVSPVEGKPIKSMTIDVTLMHYSGMHTDRTAMQYWDPNWKNPKTGEKGRWVEIVSRRKNDKNHGFMKLGPQENYGGPTSKGWTSGKVTIPAQNGKPPIIRFINRSYGGLGPTRSSRVYDHKNIYQSVQEDRVFTANDGRLLTQDEFKKYIRDYTERPLKAKDAVDPNQIAADGAHSIGHPVYKDGEWTYDFYNAAASNNGAQGRTFVENYGPDGAGTDGVPGGKFANQFFWHDGGNVNLGRKYRKDRPDYDVRINYTYAPTPPDNDAASLKDKVPTLEKLKTALPPNGGTGLDAIATLQTYGFNYQSNYSKITEPDAAAVLDALNDNKLITAADLKGMIDSNKIRLRPDGTWSLSSIKLTNLDRAKIVGSVLGAKDINQANKNRLLENLTGTPGNEIAIQIDRIFGNDDGKLTPEEAKNPINAMLFQAPTNPAKALFSLRSINALDKIDKANKPHKVLSQPVKPGIQGIHSEFKAEGRKRANRNLKAATNWDPNHKGADVQALAKEFMTMLMAAAKKKVQGALAKKLNEPAVRAVVRNITERASKQSPTPKPKPLTKAEANGKSIVGFSHNFNAVVFDNYLDIGLSDVANPGLIKQIGLALVRRGFKFHGRIGHYFETIVKAEEQISHHEKVADEAAAKLFETQGVQSPERDQLVRNFRRSKRLVAAAKNIMDEVGKMDLGLSVRIFVPLGTIKPSKINPGIATVAPGEKNQYLKLDFGKLEFTLLARLGVVEAAGNPKAILGFDQAGFEVSADFAGFEKPVKSVTVNFELEAGVIGSFFQKILSGAGFLGRTAKAVAKRMTDAAMAARGNAEDQLRAADAVLTDEERAALNEVRADGPWWAGTAEILNGQARLTWDLEARRSPLLTQAQKTTKRPDYVRLQGLLAVAKTGVMGAGAGYSPVTYSNDVAGVIGGGYSWTMTAAGRVAARKAGKKDIPADTAPPKKEELRR